MRVADQGACSLSGVFRVPDDGDALLGQFAGKMARVEEIGIAGTAEVVGFSVAGVTVTCPLAYLGNALRRQAYRVTKCSS